MQTLVIVCASGLYVERGPKADGYYTGFRCRHSKMDNGMVRYQDFDSFKKDRSVVYLFRTATVRERHSNRAASIRDRHFNRAATAREWRHAHRGTFFLGAGWDPCVPVMRSAGALSWRRLRQGTEIY